MHKSLDLIIPVYNSHDALVKALASVAVNDIDFKLKESIIKQVADFACVKTPQIDETMSWYQKIAVEKEEFRFSDYNITDYDSFSSFYSL